MYRRTIRIITRVHSIGLGNLFLVPALLPPAGVPAVVDVEVAVLEGVLIVLLVGLCAVAPIFVGGELLAAVSLHGAGGGRLLLGRVGNLEVVVLKPNIYICMVLPP